MERQKKKRLTKILRLFITIYLCIIAMPFTFLTTLAKYTSIVSASDTVGIARPVLNLQTAQVSDTVNPVNSIEVNFSVVNYEGAVVNEVKLNYIISFLIDDSVTIPLQLNLYDESNSEIPLDADNTSVQAIAMPASTATTHNYTLVVSWEGEDFSYTYAGLSKMIKVSLDVEQAEVM